MRQGRTIGSLYKDGKIKKLFSHMHKAKALDSKNKAEALDSNIKLTAVKCHTHFVHSLIKCFKSLIRCEIVQ